MVNPGDGGPWGWRTLVMATPGDGRPWDGDTRGWRTVGMAISGDGGPWNGGPWGWRTRTAGIAICALERQLLSHVMSHVNVD
jgi:hypothetical protein